jgi:hypothetical protein
VKKRYALFAVPIALAALLLALVGGASATPSQTSACSGCHGAGSATISVTVGAQTATTTTYQVSGSAGNGGTQAWGAFTGGAKVAGGSGAGSFTVARDGKTYVIYWIDKNPSNMTASTSTSVTALAATTTTTVPASTTTTVPASTTTTVPAGTTTTTAGATTTTTANPATTPTTVSSTTTTLERGTTATTARHGRGQHGERHDRQRAPKATNPQNDHITSLGSDTEDGLGAFARALDRLLHLS